VLQDSKLSAEGDVDNGRNRLLTRAVPCRVPRPAPAVLPAQQTNVRAKPDDLPNLNLEKRGIRVTMAPPEVFRPLVTFHSSEITVLPALLQQVGAVSTIFLVVPRVIVAALAMAVPLLLTLPVVSSGRHRGNEKGGAQQQAA
jgi:hypothetical protein